MRTTISAARSSETWRSTGRVVARGDRGLLVRLDDLGRGLAGLVDAGHGEVVGAAGAHGDDAADRDRELRARRTGGVAGEEDRRPGGVGRRRHPGVDAGDGGGHRLAAAESLGELLDPLRPGIDEADHQEEDGEEADRMGIAPGEAGRGQAGPERSEAGEQPLAVGHPQRLRGRVAGADGDRVGEGGRRPVEEAARLLDAKERRGAGRRPQPDGPDHGHDRGDREGNQDDDADGIGHHPPQPKPGDDGEEGRDEQDRHYRGPDRFPQNHQPGAPNRGFYAPPRNRLAVGGGLVKVRVFGSGHPPIVFRRSYPHRKL